MDSTSRIVIVGGGLAGAKAAETVRDHGFDGQVTLLCRETERPYERPPLSKGYLLGTEERAKVFVHPPGWYADHDVDLRLGTPAVTLAPAEHEVETADGERIGYDALLMATGSAPNRLQVPGADLESVFYLRELGHAEHLLDVLEPGHRMVVIGAGWIGLEVAAAARAHDVDVTVVEQAETPLAGVLGTRVGEVFADLHRRRGVDVRTGTGVRQIVGDAGRVVAVVTTSGEEILADTVMVGIGASPVVDLAEGAGLEVDDGVLVDASLRTSDPDIYAAGDIASVAHPLLGTRVRVEHWANALDSGPAAARAMVGETVSYDRLPFFFTDQYDLGMEYVGHAPQDALNEVVLRGDVAGLSFHAFWLSGGRVCAGMQVNMWDEGIGPVEELVRSGREVDPARLADPEISLDDA